MFQAQILCQNVGHNSFWNPQITFYFSRCQSPIIIDCSCTQSIFSDVLFWQAFYLGERESLSTDSQPCLKHLCHTFICAALIVLFPKAFWIIQIVSAKEYSRENTKSDADSLLWSLSHFECTSHTVHMLTQRCLPPPLTSTVKSSLFTHAHSSPLTWLPGYINVAHTVLVLLIKAGLFSDKSHTYINVCMYEHLPTNKRTWTSSQLDLCMEQDKIPQSRITSPNQIHTFKAPDRFCHPALWSSVPASSLHTTWGLDSGEGPSSEVP